MTYRKIIPAAAAAILLASTAFASAQTREYPRYWGGYGYYGGPSITFGIGPGYYAPGYYSPGYYDYAPGWNCGLIGCTTYDGWHD